jgi:hypothetical protein
MIVTFSLYFLIFVGGITFGSFLSWLRRKRTRSGIMYISQAGERTLYSLELEDFPETLAFKKEVVFQVNRVDKPKPPDESLDRE